MQLFPLQSLPNFCLLPNYVDLCCVFCFFYCTLPHSFAVVFHQLSEVSSSVVRMHKLSRFIEDCSTTIWREMIDNEAEKKRLWVSMLYISIWTRYGRRKQRKRVAMLSNSNDDQTHMFPNGIKSRKKENMNWMEPMCHSYLHNWNVAEFEELICTFLSYGTYVWYCR